MLIHKGVEGGEVPPLSAADRAHGKRLHFLFAFFNAISWAALAEGVVILMLLRLGANERWVGAVTALQYITLPAMALGFITIKRLGVTGTAGMFWALRSVSAGLMVAAPLATGMGPQAPLWMMFVGALGFMLGRAGGLMSFTGIITELTTPRDRGELISKVSLVAQFASVLMTVMMVLFLSGDPPIHRYQIFVAVGVSCGLVAAWAIWRIPEAGLFLDTPAFRPLQELRWSISNHTRRWFMGMMLAIPMTQGVTYAFGILVAKQGYGLSDQQTMLFVLAATAGGVAASQTYAHFMDMLGSRPLLILTSFLDMVGVLLVVLMPAEFNWWMLALMFFINGYVMVAFNAAIQHYFISITNRAHQLAQGIITRAMGGIVGGVSLAVAGLLLGHLKREADLAFKVLQDPDPLLHFRWFYGGVLALLVLRTVIFFKLPSLMAHGVRDALNVLFSPWDWRAIHAVRRAVNAQSEKEETRALGAMRRTGSAIYADEYVRYLASPSMEVRRRALQGLTQMRSTPPLIALLEDDVRENHFTTAHLSAALLGHWGVKEATPLLRASLHAPDFQLCGAAIHALVELDSREDLPLIRARFGQSENPYVLIEGARALAMWGGVELYPLLLEKYHLDIPPQTKDELSLAVSRVLGLYDAFYSALGMLRREPTQCFQELRGRLGERDAGGLLDALEKGDPRRSALLATLERRAGDFQPWFEEQTRTFLEKRPERVFPQMAFLMSFLLLAEHGLHLNQE